MLMGANVGGGGEAGWPAMGCDIWCGDDGAMAPSCVGDGEDGGSMGARGGGDAVGRGRVRPIGFRLALGRERKGEMRRANEDGLAQKIWGAAILETLEVHGKSFIWGI